MTEIWNAVHELARIAASDWFTVLVQHLIEFLARVVLHLARAL
jgi:hypothetical protein